MSTLPVPIGGMAVPTAELTDALSSAVDYAQNAKSAATLRAYASDWRHYTAWCESVSARPLPRPDVPEDLPEASLVVAAYLAHLADVGLKANTINRRAAAITFAFRKAGFTPPTAAESIKGLQRGIRRTIGTAVTRKAPATDKHVRAMIKALPDTLAGLRDRAVLAIGFAAGMRRSELVALDVRHIERVPEGIRLTIERSKTDQEGAGREVPILRGSKLKPVFHLDAWLVAAGITVGALFRPVGKGGRVLDSRLTDRSVAEIVKHAAGLAKFDPTLFSGHSLRAGLVTTALEHGADHMKIMDITGHTLTLPAASGGTASAPLWYHVRKRDGSGRCTVVPNGTDKIDGTNAAIAVYQEYVTLVSFGSGWIFPPGGRERTTYVVPPNTSFSAVSALTVTFDADVIGAEITLDNLSASASAQILAQMLQGGSYKTAGYGYIGENGQNSTDFSNFANSGMPMTGQAITPTSAAPMTARLSIQNIQGTAAKSNSFYSHSAIIGTSSGGSVKNDYVGQLSSAGALGGAKVYPASGTISGLYSVRITRA